MIPAKSVQVVNLPLMPASRQVHEEASIYAYCQQIFAFTHRDQASTWLQKIGKRNSGFIRHVYLGHCDRFPKLNMQFPLLWWEDVMGMLPALQSISNFDILDREYPRFDSIDLEAAETLAISPLQVARENLRKSRLLPSFDGLKSLHLNRSACDHGYFQNKPLLEILSVEPEGLGPE